MVNRDIVVVDESLIHVRLEEIFKVALSTTRHQYYNLIISGGSVLKYLNEMSTDFFSEWNRVRVFFADERCVPFSSEQSNYGTFINGSFFKRTKISVDNVIHIDENSIANAERCAELYERRIRGLFEKDERIEFDIVLLGIGEDGHTASLFPNASNLTSFKMVDFINDSPKEPKDRITLTVKFLNEHCKQNIFLASGSIKSKVISLVLNENISDPKFPFSLIENCKFILDSACAQGLSIG